MQVYWGQGGIFSGLTVATPLVLTLALSFSGVVDVAPLSAVNQDIFMDEPYRSS